MTTDVQVKMEKEPGTKYQWMKGIVWKQDGRKQTLAGKTLTWLGGLGFVVTTVLLVLQGSPELAPKQSSVIPSPEGIEASQPIDIPATGSSNDSASQGSRSRSKLNQMIYSKPQLLLRPGTTKIPPGSMIMATLVSGASDGPVKAKATESLTVNGDTKIPEGTLFVGRGQSGEDRLQISFSKIVFADGSFDSIDAQACDQSDQVAGLIGSKIGNQAVKLAAGIGLEFAGGMSAALQDTEGQSGTTITKPTLKNALLNGAATASLEQSRELMSNWKSKRSPIFVPSGTSICIFFEVN